MTEQDKQTLIAAAQVLLREGMWETFIDTGEEVFTNADIAGDLMSMAGWNWGYDHVFPQDERPNLVVSVGGAYSSIADYYGGIIRNQPTG